VTRLVADDDERAEGEPPAAFDDLGDAVDVDDALFELLVINLIECHLHDLRVGAGAPNQTREP
jgi:hypothetical protein